jgi:hypothetical protein
MALSELNPGQGAIQETVGKRAYGWSQMSGLPPHTVGGTHGVEAAFRRVIARVGGAPASGLAGMHLYHGAPVINADQLTVSLYLYLRARRACGVGHRIEGIAVGDVIIGMHHPTMPVRDIVRLAVIREKGGLLFLLENHQGKASRGTMDTLASYLHTPVLRLSAQVCYANEVSALEEALPYILNATLHTGLVMGMAYSGRVGEEPAVLGILQKAAGETRV